MGEWVDQSGSQSVSQTVGWWVSRRAIQSVDCLVLQLVCQSVGQSISYSVGQSVSQSVIHLVYQSVIHSVS